MALIKAFQEDNEKQDRKSPEIPAVPSSEDPMHIEQNGTDWPCFAFVIILTFVSTSSLEVIDTPKYLLCQEWFTRWKYTADPGKIHHTK